MKRPGAFIQALTSFIALAACVLTATAQETKSSKAHAKDEATISESVKQMETGWNTKSGALFAKPFAEDADYVVINGMHIKGRSAIEQGHQQIFDTIYKNTSLSMSVKQIRFLRKDVALAHVAAHLKMTMPDGAREHDAIITMVLTKDNQGWKIAAFQNTQVENQQGR